jgi:proline racemase
VSERDPGERPPLRVLHVRGGAGGLSARLSVHAVDYHTAGEPFRIVTGGVPQPVGETILDKRRWAAERLDAVRRLLVFEPRGHADMYGCFVTEPEDEGADLGVVFFHNEGYSTGRVALREPETRFVVDAPSGRLETVARVENGLVCSVRFQNVPSFVAAEGLWAEGLRADVAFGGAFYASVRSPLPVASASVPALIELGRGVKRGLEADRTFAHPDEPELRDVYGVIFWEPVEAGPPLRQRNVTVFADGQVDRSPCGSGTSARLSLLDRAGELPRGAELVHESVIGTEFRGRVVGEARVAGLPAVVTEVEGSAHRTGAHEFTLDPADPLAEGFLLR